MWIVTFWLAKVIGLLAAQNPLWKTESFLSVFKSVAKLFPDTSHTFPAHCTLFTIYCTSSWFTVHFSPMHRTAQNFSGHTASASDGWQALHHSWACHTQVCGTYTKGDTITADVYLGNSSTTGSDKPWFSILDSDPISVGTKVPTAGISHAIFGFLLHCQNIRQVGQGCQASARTFRIVYAKWYGWHW